MNPSRLPHRRFSSVWIAWAAFLMLLAACRPATSPDGPQPGQPTETGLPTAPATAAQPPAGASGDLTLDLATVIQGQSFESIPAVPAGAGGPWWEVMPQHRRVTLETYPVTGHHMEPQVFIYPAADLAEANEAAGQAAADLQTLLETRQPGERLPFLPLINAAQAMHAQVQYLDFKNGRGVRYLSQFNQGLSPVNNFELIYTFQGLTGDGQYYVAAVLPVTHPELPSTLEVSEEQIEELNDFPAYMAQTTGWLDAQPGASFTPDLADLDALIQLLEVK